MRTPTLPEFKRWAKANHRLARAVCLAQAFAQVERERVDAYIKPVFARFEFFVRLEWSEGRVERITERKNIYLSDQEALCREYYDACDIAHREHGFDGEKDHCPALEADSLRIDAENALLDAGTELIGIDKGQLYGDTRKRMLDLLLGACLKADQKKAA